jgi:hypothetical protein
MNKAHGCLNIENKTYQCLYWKSYPPCAQRSSFLVCNSKLQMYLHSNSNVTTEFFKNSCDWSMLYCQWTEWRTCFSWPKRRTTLIWCWSNGDCVIFGREAAARPGPIGPHCSQVDDAISLGSPSSTIESDSYWGTLTLTFSESNSY